MIEALIGIILGGIAAFWVAVAVRKLYQWGVKQGIVRGKDKQGDK